MSQEKEPSLMIPVRLLKDLIKIVKPENEAERRPLNEAAYLLKLHDNANDEVIQATLNSLRQNHQDERDTSGREVIVNPEQLGDI